ncbi:PAP/fibrillin family protein [Polymorphobacter sp.]|uniref:PAP/fibrillin family protein n=1 Tax=Polymorphobacter sp. TaxID=1909290 RepID=UPI003F702391
MTDIHALKTELRAAIEHCQPDGSYDDDTCERIHTLVGALVPLTPTPSPFARQDFVESPWVSEFAQFGAKHTAGKPIQHLSSMKLQSFSRLPDLPIRVLAIEQEIRVEGRHYNNVTAVTTPDGAHAAQLIVWGRYDVGAAEPQRYAVEFYAVELVAPAGISDDELRAQFGMEAGSPLRIELKPPRLHSDIVYCDEDMRINFGSLGGIYVLKRLATPGKSVSFTPAPALQAG